MSTLSSLLAPLGSWSVTRLSKTARQVELSLQMGALSLNIELAAPEPDDSSFLHATDTIGLRLRQPDHPTQAELEAGEQVFACLKSVAFDELVIDVTVDRLPVVGARDESFWRGKGGGDIRYVSLSTFLASPRRPCDHNIAITTEDLPALEAFRVDGFRLTLAVGPAVNDRFGEKSRVFPYLGLINLASFLRARGATVSISDTFVDGTFTADEMRQLGDHDRVERMLGGGDDPVLADIITRWAARLEETRPDAIGLSAKHRADPLSFVLLKRHLAAQGKKVPFIVGGNWDGGTERLTEVDVLLTSEAEGEVPLLLVCHSLMSGESPRWVPGVTFRRSDGSWHQSVPSHAMDVRATPDLEGFPLSQYTGSSYTGWPGGTVPYQFSSGCPYNCGYCNAEHKRRLRERDPALVLRDLETILDQDDVHQLFFLNTAFNNHPAYAEALLTKMIGTRRPWRWCDCARPTASVVGLFPQMRRAGCEWLNWGYDTPSDRLARIYGRPVDGETFGHIMTAAAQAGIKNTINLLFGLPGETDDDFVELLQFFERYHASIHWVFFLPYNFIPNSEIGRAPERFGLVLRPDRKSVDEIDGLTWDERCEQGARNLARIKAELTRRYGYR